MTTANHPFRALAGGIVAVATLLGGMALAPAAVAADSPDADTAPSVAGHPYNDLPYNNPTISVTQIDNSDLPSYMRNPIGQNEGVGSDDLDENYYSADAAALAYDGKLFVLTGHDEASPSYGSFNMRNWGAYVTDDPESGKWTHYKNIMQADLFTWSTGDGAYAGHLALDDGGTPNDTSDDWFYYYVPVKDANAPDGADPFSIGVAKSRSPLGPWKDAIGEPLLTTTQTGIETIDPMFFTDDDGANYLYFGTFNTQLAVKMDVDASTGRSSFTEVETGADGEPVIHTMKDADGGNGPKGFFEAAWVFRKGDTYYNVYDGGKPGSGAATCVESNYQACVQYSTSDDPLGPWTYQGVIVPSGSSTTMHPSVLRFGDRWYVTYHTGDKEGGTDFRRAVSIGEVTWKDGVMSAVAHPTKAEKTQPSRNVAPYAKVSATFTETPAWKGSVNDGRVLVTAVVPPNHWTNYRSMPQTQSGDSLIYQWDGEVRVDSAKVWFDMDSNALRAPGSWKLQYLTADGEWKDVDGPSGYTTSTGKNAPNAVSFDAVTTTALKLDMTGQQVDGGYASVAVAEWEVYSALDEAAIAEPKGVTTATGAAPELPVTVDVTAGDETISTPVIWRPIDASSYTDVKSGTTFTAYGVVAGVEGPAGEHGNVKATVTVKDGHTSADTTKPTVKVALAANAGNGTWLTNAPIATVQAADDSAAPVARLEISTDQGGNWTVVATNANAGVAAISVQGDVEVWARAVDRAGNVSDIAKANAKVDSAAPKIIATVDKETRTLALAADDGSGSGVAGIEYRIGGEDAWTAYTQPVAAPTASRTTVRYRATDKAGNTSVEGKTDIPSDTSVPLVGWIEQEATATDVDKAASGWTKGVAALNDGTTFQTGCSVGNECIWGTWPNTNQMRLDYEWDREVTIDSSRVQFTSDGGGLAAPASWSLQYWDGEVGDYVDVPDATYTVTDNNPTAGFGETNDGWSDATWTTPVKTTKLRMVINPSNASPAIVEWQVHAPETVTPDPDPEPDPDPDPDPDPNPTPDPDPDPDPNPTPEPGEQADMAALNAAIAKAEKLDLDRYTKQSAAQLRTALASARKVAADGNATQQQVDAAVQALDEAVKGLKAAGASGAGAGAGASGATLSKTGVAVGAVLAAGLLSACAGCGVALLRGRARRR